MSMVGNWLQIFLCQIISQFDDQKEEAETEMVWTCCT